MRLAAAIAGCLLVGFVLMDAFKTLVLTRRTGQSFHPTRFLPAHVAAVRGFCASR
jgi:hypothetical protein